MYEKLYVGDIVEMDTNVPAGWNEFREGIQRFEVLEILESKNSPYLLRNTETGEKERPVLSGDWYEDFKLKVVYIAALEND